MPRGNSKKGTPARGQGVKRRRMADPKEKEQPIASVVNPRSSGESVIDFSSDPGPSQTSTGTESNIFNENIQFSQSLPCLEESLFDQIGCYVPMKLKDKIWKHEFIDLNLLIKSPRELANFPDHEGDLVVKGGHMRIESLPCRAIPNIHTWTSAFMIYMSILLEKQSSLAQELLKYMRDIRFAANKSHGWGTYDEQFRLRKAQRPQSSWAVINQDLWSFYITTAMRDQGQSNESKVGFSSQSEPLHSFRQSSGQQNVQQPRTCNAYNTKGKRCNFNPCRFKHGCSACGGQHPAYFSDEKTISPTTRLTFLGVEIDTSDMTLRLPSDKLDELLQKISFVLKCKKVTLREMQSLLGSLNFACRVVVPGRAFCRRLIDSTIGLNKPHYRIRITSNIKADLLMWKSFLKNFNGLTLMPDRLWTSNEALEFYTDSAGGSTLGFGIYFKGRWAHGLWPRTWHKRGLLSNITFLELFPVMVAIILWGSELRNKKVLFHIDNEGAVHIINKKSSKSSDVMVLVRRLVLETLHHNILIKADHVPVVPFPFPFPEPSTKCISDTNSNSEPSMDSITEESARLFSDSLAGNTWKSYSRARSVLDSFQLLYTLDKVWPVPVEQTEVNNIITNSLNSFRFVGHELQSTIWIMGSSIPHWAGITAASRSGGKNLNLDRLGVQVKWITKSGMKWKDLDSSF
ncbi:unnamed protein product [Mytilus edulis]|uniref:C3H1-type domain-containing protein n=1 Tax=Mytilus edulis TaxID=6550 RepID=A0A8S3TMR9_MYTED|nr:unnamed protein product [Mytilus edulis]